MSKSNINVNHNDYNVYSLKWKRCRDVVQGQDAIYAGKTNYLPKLLEETDEDYKARLERTTFFNATFRTISSFVGLLFRKEIIVKVPSKVEEYLEDITMSGVSLNAFAKRIANEVIEVNRVGILVDYPKMIINDDGSDLTIAQTEKLGLRPNLQMYKTESIINWKFDRVNNQNVLTQLRLIETIDEVVDEFTTDQKTIIRVLDLVDNIYRQRIFDADTEKQIGDDIIPQMNGKSIPFIPFYFIDCDGSNGDEIKEPVLIDLVNLNLKHFTVSADYEHGCHMTALPTPYITGYEGGVDNNGEAINNSFYIGSGAAWVFPNEQTQVGFLEFSGQGLQALENNLNRKEAQMAALGAEALAPEKNGVEAFNTKALRSNGENSTLASIAISVSDGLAKALDVLCEWSGQSGECEFSINKDFMPISVDAQSLNAWLSAVQSGNMSRENFFNLLDRADLIIGDVDFNTEQGRIEQTPIARPVERPEPNIDENNEET